MKVLVEFTLAEIDKVGPKGRDLLDAIEGEVKDLDLEGWSVEGVEVRTEDQERATRKDRMENLEHSVRALLKVWEAVKRDPNGFSPLNSTITAQENLEHLLEHVLPAEVRR